ncbi:MAG: ExbD/TolR family protein [Kiritimatiellia bacterium]
MRALIQEEERQGLRVAPLIDMVFLLLTYFLVATTYYESEKDITIRLASATEGQERQKTARVVVINIRKSGVLVVNERVKTLEEVEQLLREAKQQNSEVFAVLRCDKQAYHNEFVRVLNVCEKVGITGVGVATFEADE